MSSPILIALLAVGLSGQSVPPRADGGAVLLAAEDCAAAAARVVAETGGILLSAIPRSDGTCEVIVLKNKEGERREKIIRREQP